MKHVLKKIFLILFQVFRCIFNVCSGNNKLDDANWRTSENKTPYSTSHLPDEEEILEKDGE